MADSTFLVERSISINASTGTVHELINNFHHWLQWSPWEGIDPDLQRTYKGPDAGVGTYYGWQGNRKVGSGEMTITASTPDSIVLDLNFLKPFKANNVTTFLVQEEEKGTKLVWQMTGKKNLFFKLFGFVLSMDKMVGKDFEKGLQQLKAAAEKS
ncbi:MAG: SRPBCC family protein [Mycobacteriaceae bacterium]